MTTASASGDIGKPTQEISITKLHKRYGADVIYQDFNLDIPSRKVTAFFGPNGCGKSTLINMISGLADFQGGSILFNGRTLEEVKIGYVFQNYRDALFPWLRSIDNIAYPLRLMKMAPNKIARRLNELVTSFDIGFDLSRYPYQLSGGQQQLVSILRALAPDPEVIFLDEPFSALDFEMTLFVREKLHQLYEQTQKTLVIVSHDLEEAVHLADQVVLLTKRPTRVAEIVDIDIVRPRGADLTTDPGFISAKRRCFEIFDREMKRT